MKKKTKKAWVVIWTNKAAEEYGVREKYSIITIEPQEEIKVPVRGKKMKYLTATPMALFEKRAEAVAYKNNNPDFKCVPCTIII